LEEDFLPPPHGISLADAALIEGGLPRGIRSLRRSKAHPVALVVLKEV
jgi:hypothetical protein